MAITISNILSTSIFHDAQLIAGTNGLNKPVEKIGVYDYVETIYDITSYLPHSLYISNLGQFKQGNKSLLEAFKVFGQTEASGILIMEDNLSMITSEIIDFCNTSAFPIICFNRDLLYSDIITSVSYMIQTDNQYVLMNHLIDKLLYEKNDHAIKMSLIRELSFDFKDYICVLNVNGAFLSDLFQHDVDNFFYKQKGNLYVKYNDSHLFIFSDYKETDLIKSVNASINIIKSMQAETIIGESQVEKLVFMDKAIKNALTASKISEITKKKMTIYNPLLDMYLLIDHINSPTAIEIYETIYHEIQLADQNEKIKYLDCVLKYVEFGGNFKKVAEVMFVHENTVRYRINNLRERLGFGDNIVRFHEMLSIFTSIHYIFCAAK